MCGNFDDNASIDEELFDSFVDTVKHFGVAPEEVVAGALKLDSEDARAGYMDTLFRAGLKRCVDDAAQLPAGERMDAIAGQAIVFARLAGFLASRFPPEADLFRAVTTAVIDGHDDPEHSH